MRLVTCETGAYAVWRTRINAQKLIGTEGCGWALGLAAAPVGLSPFQLRGGAGARQSSRERASGLELDIMVDHHSRIADPRSCAQA
jgi:hypothetical protein